LKTIAVVLGGMIAATSAAADLGTPGQRPYMVIVNAANPGGVVSREVLADIFLKKATRWTSGAPIEVVDQSLESEIREAFCRDALELTPRAVMSYWQEQLRSGGERPPFVKASDTEVLEYVSTRPGAIGYVSAGTPVDGAVRVLQVAD